MSEKVQNSPYFQDYMDGNICFGCGTHNHEGLQIKSHWEGEEMICVWHSEDRYQGWRNLLNGGVLATLIDCHCMATATSHAYQLENNRAWDTEPIYRYATGTLTVKYLKPTPNDQAITLRARILAVKGRKTTMACAVWVGGEQTAEAEVIAIRVYDSSEAQANNPFEG
jgi:acyl-coenzyme A thioesterase PaaI-like protein